MIADLKPSQRRDKFVAKKRYLDNGRTAFPKFDTSIKNEIGIYEMPVQGEFP